jgi:hypothetical protein
MPMRLHQLAPIFFISVLLALVSGCSVHKKMNVAAAAALVEDISKASARQKDTRVIREGLPAYLLLMDGMVEGWPENAQLRLAAAQAYATFASAFIEEDDRAYREVLLLKARDHALCALELRGFRQPQSSDFEQFDAELEATHSRDAPYLFWAATAWGNWINLNISSISAMAELPRVEKLIRRVIELDEGYYYGGAHLFMGILMASRPKIAGGSLDKARAHFLKAKEMGHNQFLMADIYYAQYYAKKRFDKDLYIQILKDVLAQPADLVPELTLLNTVAQKKAAKMLAEADDYF